MQHTTTISVSRRTGVFARALAILTLLATPAWCDGPWVTIVNNLKDDMTGPIAKALSLVAIVIGGLLFAYGEHGAKKAFAGIIFGVGIAVLATNVLTWITG